MSAVSSKVSIASMLATTLVAICTAASKVFSDIENSTHRKQAT